MKRGRRLRILAVTLLLGIAGFIGLGIVWPQFALDAEYARLRYLADASTETTVVDDHTIVSLRAGDGPPVVLLHGFTGMKENWLQLMPHLSARHRLIVPDLPGWGDSTRLPDTDYGYAAQAERVARFLATVSDEPVDVIGHSMGGAIAAVLAARHPERVRRLVLMDSGGVRFRDNDFGRAVLRGENPFAVADRADLDRYMALLFDDPPLIPWPADSALIARRVRDADFEQSVLDRIGRSEEAFLPAAESARIAAPTLLLWCRNDRVIDVSAAQLFADVLPDSRTVLLDGCSHMPLMERPVETAAALEEFLQ